MRKIQNKPLYVLGLNEALGAAAALLKDGEIIAAALEERFTRIKNHWGYPKRAIQFCLDFAGISSRQLDLVVLSYEDPYPHFTKKRAEERLELSPALFKKLRDLAPALEYSLPLLSAATSLGRSLYYTFYQPRLKNLQTAEIARHLQISTDKIVRVDHHVCHATTAFYANSQFKSEKTLLLTCDGAGDNHCATVSVARRGNIERIAQTSHTHSLGLFYAAITSYLGLKAHEDEYKVMGLAPYAASADLTKLKEIFTTLLWVDGLKFASLMPARHYGLYLKDKLPGFRFDHIATATQKFLEDRLVDWVSNAIEETGIRDLTFSGGVFLNVKANQEILKRTKVRRAFFLPSPGDDTNAIGACYYGFKQMQPAVVPQPLHHLYLGPEFSDKEVYKTLAQNKKYKITRPENIAKTVAKLLSQGEVVARFWGRMEFGARALGNRSILADPRRREIVEKINNMIKMRDFWMPFAPTILREKALHYVKNPKRVEAPYMILAFETTELGRTHLAAAIHPHDKSCRPQILDRDVNPEYYGIIIEFEKLTGVEALLNTSFNIHGEPIVATPRDALRVFTRTELRYLQIGNILVSK